jgi:hypothetical protein
MSDLTWYEQALNQRGLDNSILRARLGNIRAAALPLRQISACLAAGLTFDPHAASELINALLREIDKEIS